jgi:hypothetical protein
LAEYEQLDRAGKGALLRREGLYNQLISYWRKQRGAGAAEALERPVGRPKADPRDRRIAKLEAENARLSAELAKTRTVVEVQESSARCWISSPPAARTPTGASHDDHHHDRDDDRD